MCMFLLEIERLEYWSRELANVDNGFRTQNENAPKIHFKVRLLKFYVVSRVETKVSKHYFRIIMDVAFRNEGAMYF